MPAPIRPNTAAAAERRRQIGDQVAANRLRDRGWLVLEPELAAAAPHRQTIEDRLSRPADEVTGWVMAAYSRDRAGRDLPRLHWRRFEHTGGRLDTLLGWSSARGPEALAELSAWAETFGLQRKSASPGQPAGRASFVGDVDGCQMEVYGYVGTTDTGAAAAGGGA